MDLDTLKKALQNHLTDGLVTLVGSGVSAAAGLPSMMELGTHLQSNVPSRISTDLEKEWAVVSAALGKGDGIEAALKDIDANSGLIPIVVKLVSELIEPKEQKVIEELLSGSRKLPFSELLEHITFTSDRHTIITTNYDRLLEFAAEVSGVAVDTLFDGRLYGQCDQKKSRYAVGILENKQTRAGVKIKYRQHIVILKPHGSLDWYAHQGNPIRCMIPNGSSDRLMIVPGSNKYRKGYESPFDLHRSEANSAIDKAARYLVIGYGFNDDHLETHLRQELKKGKPCLVLNRSVSNNLQNLIKDCPKILALSKKGSGTVVHHEGQVFEFDSLNLWELGGFIQEVLKI